MKKQAKDLGYKLKMGQAFPRGRGSEIPLLKGGG